MHVKWPEGVHGDRGNENTMLLLLLLADHTRTLHSKASFWSLARLKSMK
jgi:hypothetical protein